MVLVAKLISWISLVAVIAPAIFFMVGRMELDQVKLIMLISTVTWFVAAAISMREKNTG
jgi:hypothetical protein